MILNITTKDVLEECMTASVDRLQLWKVNNVNNSDQNKNGACSNSINEGRPQDLYGGHGIRGEYY